MAGGQSIVSSKTANRVRGFDLSGNPNNGDILIFNSTTGKYEPGAPAGGYTHPNHSGEVTSVGDGAQTAQATIISNKTTLGSLAGTEEFLINDGGVLKKVLASNVGGGDSIYTADGTIGAGRVATLTDSLTFDGGQVNIKGINQLGTSTALLVEDSVGTDLLKVANDGSTFIGGNTQIDGQISTDGSPLFHVSANVHTFRGSNTYNRGLAWFGGVSGGTSLSVATGGSIGLGRDASGSSSILVNLPVTVSNFMGIYDTSGTTFFARSSSRGSELKWAFGQTSSGNLNTSGYANSPYLGLDGSTTDFPQLRLLAGTDVTAPNNGDIWFNGTELKMRIGGITKTFTLT